MSWGLAAAAGISAISSAFGASKANKASQDAAEAQMEFQREMYQNRYQYQMEDMEAAGLNPILSYRQAPPGGPTGASYVAQNEMAQVPGAIQGAVTSAIDQKRQTAQQAAIDQQIAQSKAQVANTQADTKVKAATAGQIQVDTVLKTAQTHLANLNARQSSAKTAHINEEIALTKLQQMIAGAQKDVVRAKGQGAKIEYDLLKTTVGKWLKWIDIAGRSINPFASAAQSGASAGLSGSKIK